MLVMPTDTGSANLDQLCPRPSAWKSYPQLPALGVQRQQVISVRLRRLPGDADLRLGRPRVVAHHEHRCVEGPVLHGDLKLQLIARPDRVPRGVARVVT